MKFSTKVTSAIAAASAATLGAGLLAFTPGLSAAFSDSSTANVSISVGDFGCAFSKIANTPGVTINTDGTATIALDAIQSSAPSQQTKQVNVKNTGTMALVATITGQRTGGPSTFSAVPVTPVIVTSGQTAPVDLGIQWTELSNAQLTSNATVKYTLTCTETPAALYPNTNWVENATYPGTATWNPDGSITIASSSTPPAGFGGTLHFDGVSATLPSAEPTFTSDHNVAGNPSPYFRINLSNGAFLQGYVKTQTPSVFGWQLIKGTSTMTPMYDSTWAAVSAAVLAVTPAVTVANAGVQANGTPTSFTLTCASYDGTNFVGTGTCVAGPQS